MSAPPKAAPAAVPPVPGEPPPRAAELAERAMDPRNLDDVERAIQQLSPDEAAHFIAVLNRGIKRRRIQLVGYLLALLTLLGGQFAALLYYAAAEPGHFVGWVFFVPFLFVGAIFWLFGRWAARVE